MIVQPNLVSMPPELMEKITKDFDLWTVQSFRKTCRCLRNYIETVEIDPSIHSTSITIDGVQQHIIIAFNINVSMVKVVYKACRNGCLVEFGKKKKLLKNADFATVAGNDLGLILRHNKCYMRVFYMYNEKNPDTIFERLWNSLEPHLQRRKSLLQSDHLKVVNMTNQDRYMRILPYFEPGKLTKLCIIHRGMSLNLDRIVQTEQWKQLKVIELGVSKMVTSLASFHQFPNVEFGIDEVSTHDLVLLKDKIIQNQYRHVKHDFLYNRLTDPKELLRAFEPWYAGRRYGLHRWFIPYAEGTKTLEVRNNIDGCEFRFRTR